MKIRTSSVFRQIVAFLLIIGIFAGAAVSDSMLFYVKAEEELAVLDSGKCGDQLFWELTSDGTLRIFGEGRMYDYNKYYEPSPWYKYRNEPFISEDGTQILNSDGTVYLSTKGYYEDNPNGYKVSNIVIEEGVTYIGDWAFYRVCVEELTVPEGVEETGIFCFRFSPVLKKITLPDSLKILDDFAISRNYLLTTINIGNSLETVGTGGFNNNPSLTSVILPKTCTSVNTQLSPTYASINYSAVGLMENCVSLKTVSFGSVDKIPQRTCLGADIETAVIPNTVKSIDSYAFYTCDSLKNVIFEEGSTCKNIANNAFQGCTSLESVVGGTALETIGVYTLIETFSDFEFSSTNNKLEKNQFLGTSLTSVTVSENIDTIPVSCFNSMYKLEKIYLPSSLKKIEGSSFNYSSKLMDVYYNGNLEDYNAIEKVSGWSYGMNSGCVVHLSDGTFANVKGEALAAENVEFTVKFVDSDGTLISEQRVKHSASAVSPTPPEHEGYTFAGWDKDFAEITDSITVIATYTKNPEVIKVVDSGKCGEELYWEFTSDGVLRIFGEGRMYDYNRGKNTAPWYKYRNEPLISEDNENVMNPDGTVFCEASEYFDGNPTDYRITDIVIEQGVTYIGDNAFYRVCTDEITLPEGVEETGIFCLSFSPSLKTINLPDSLKVLDDFAIYKNYSLEKIDMSSSLEKIGTGGLSENPCLTEVILPDSCTVINEQLSPASPGIIYELIGLMANCTSLKTVKFGKVDKIPQRALLNTVVEEVIVPKTVKSIDSYAFYSCDSLKRVIFEEDSVCKNISDTAFSGCSSLESVVGGTSLETLGSYSGIETLKEFEFSASNKELMANQFNSTALTEVRISQLITVIPTACFCNMASLEVVYIPQSIQQIQASSFNYCSALSDIYYGSTLSDWLNIQKESGWSYMINSDCVIHFSDGTSAPLKDISATPDSSEPDPVVYTVTFKDYDGTVISVQSVMEGESALAPENPQRKGYVFAGWDKSFADICSDLEVTATYTPDTENPVFFDVVIEIEGGTCFYAGRSGNVLHPFGKRTANAKIELNAELSVDAVATDSSVFEGWFDENGNLISESEEFTFVVEDDMYLIAVYS